MKMSYVDEVFAKVAQKNANEPEFIQAVTEVLESLRVVIEANEEKYRRDALLERLTPPSAASSSVFPGWTTRVRSRSIMLTVFSSTAPSVPTRAVCVSIPPLICLL